MRLLTNAPPGRFHRIVPRACEDLAMEQQGARRAATGASRGEINVWERLDVSVLQSQRPDTKVRKEGTPEGPPSWWAPVRWPILNAVSALAWAWVLVKAFLGDVDRWLMHAIAPQWQWLLDFRFFGVLALMAVVAVAVKRRYWWTLLFVVFWPLLVVVFYLPRFLYRRKSPILVVGLFHTIFGLVRSLRFAVVSVAVVAFAVLGILASDLSWMLGLCAWALVVVWSISLVKTLRYAVSPAKFVSSQRRLWSRVFASEKFWEFVHIDEKLKHPEIQKYDKDQANALMTSLSTGLACTRLAQIWATQLEAYRRSPVTTLFGCLAVFGMFLQGVFTFTLVNLAAFKADPSQYIAAYEPTGATFAYYTFASAAFGEVSALVPKGYIATAINIVTGVGTAVILFMFGAALVLGWRQSKSDEAAMASIEQMRGEADAFEERLAAEYGLGADALWRRLEELGGGFLALMPFLFARRTEPHMLGAAAHRLRKGPVGGVPACCGVPLEVRRQGIR